MVFIILIALLALVDLSIKFYIENQEDEWFPKELKGLEGKVTMHKHHNYGFPFGFLKEYRAAVKMIPVAFTSALAGYLLALLTQKGRVMEKLAVSFALGGAFSNLYDRLIRGYVVDYFTIEWKKLKKVIFNLGDLCIFLGAAMFILKELAGLLAEVLRKSG